MTTGWAYSPHQVAIREGVRAMLEVAGRDPDDPELVATPDRVLRAWLELTAAPGNPAELLGTTFAADSSGMVVVGPISFVSVCEHHLLPFTGHAWVGYIPGDGRVVGLSKLPRLVEHYARRPQMQERLGQQIVDALVYHLDPVGAGCLIRAEHACMTMRGVRAAGAAMTTSALAGALLHEPEARAEFLAQCGGRP